MSWNFKARYQDLATFFHICVTDVSYILGLNYSELGQYWSSVEGSRDTNPDRRASSMLIEATSSGKYIDFARQLS